MRIYRASSEETLRARKFLKDWADEGFLTKPQYERLERETVSELRTTNIFLRLVLFFFTLIIVGAAAGLFFEVFLSRPSDQTLGVFFLIFGAFCYAAAEFAVSRARLYRYGIEEALAVFSVGFLCAGLEGILFRGHYSPEMHPVECLVPAAGAVFSLWIWHRFGFSYAFLAAMIFAIFVPSYWTSSHAAQHAIIAAFYVVGLIVIAAVRSRHRFDCLDETYSLAEALLWLGTYLAINLKISTLDPRELWWVSRFGPGTGTGAEFSRPFYWTTWVLIWCLPPIVLARGIRQKDRFVIAAGAVAAVLTFVCNKPYLGWPRHTWDPMLLGIVLTGVAVFLRRWLTRSPAGVRYGFTAARLTGKDRQWMEVGSTVGGLLSPKTPSPQPSSPDFHFGGGASGGGGAGGDF